MNTPEYFMLKALEASQKGLPECEPNPPVGCVLVKDNQIASVGYTQKMGGNHAEVEALNNYQGPLSEVSAFVTLEPCAFVGRTPSCAKTIANSGIKNVYVAILDPDQRNNGKGVEILRAAGVNVTLGLCKDKVQRFLSPYLGLS